MIIKSEGQALGTIADRDLGPQTGVGDHQGRLRVKGTIDLRHAVDIGVRAAVRDRGRLTERADRLPGAAEGPLRILDVDGDPVHVGQGRRRIPEGAGSADQGRIVAGGVRGHTDTENKGNPSTFTPSNFKRIFQVVLNYYLIRSYSLVFFF